MMATCAICNELLEGSTGIVGFPHFISNKKDKLYKFSEAGVHVACLHTDPLANELKLTLALYDAILLKEEEEIDITGNPINDPAQLIAIGFLTTDTSEALFNYNFLDISRENIDKWDDRAHFLQTAKAFIHDGKWEAFERYDLLNDLINVLE